MPAAKLPGADELERLYWEEHLTPAQIAERYDSTARSVLTRMARLGIKRRTKSEAAILMREQGRGYVPPPTAYELKDRLRCSACRWMWQRLTNRGSEPCPKCGHATSSRKRKDASRTSNLAALRAMSPEQRRAIGAKSRQSRRLSLLMLVGDGQVRCVRCGCDRPELLEINHKLGGGAKEVKGRSATGFYQAIRRLERPTDDLELCCKVCNAWHCLELKYGPLPYTVLWAERR